jgi:hypothetical protein
MIPASFKYALLGKRVTHAWQGYGSAIFLEFGALTQRGCLRIVARNIDLSFQWPPSRILHDC